MEDLSGPRILKGLLGTRFQNVEVHPSIDSTQTVLVTEGGVDGRVVVADHQTAGRGRAGRSWLDVPGAMLMFSCLMRGIAPDRAALTGLAAGVAVARGIESVCDVSTRLKWPNDVRIDGRKVCGMLGELAPSADYVVVGIGVNVGHSVGKLPDELEATSLRIASGRPPRRDDLCVAILGDLDSILREASFWGNERTQIERSFPQSPHASRGHGPMDWLDEYRSRCETIGARVRVELADGEFEGTATEVRDDGALVVDNRPVVAGDVVHLR